MSSKNDTKSNEEESEEIEEVEEKEQVYDELKSKVEIFDILFHPTENNLLNVGLINGKLKM